MQNPIAVNKPTAMSLLGKFLGSGAFRRLVTLLLGVVFVALEKKLGLELNPTEKAEIVAMVVAYITASNWNEIQDQKIAAAKAASIEAVKPAATVAEAVNNLAGRVGPQP